MQSACTRWHAPRDGRRYLACMHNEGRDVAAEMLTYILFNVQAETTLLLPRFAGTLPELSAGPNRPISQTSTDEYSRLPSSIIGAEKITKWVYFLSR